MRMPTPRLLTLLLLAMATCSSMAGARAASPSPQATDYFRVRDGAQVREDYTAQEIRTRPDSFAGKLLEVRGVVAAIVESTPAARIILGPERTAVTTIRKKMHCKSGKHSGGGHPLGATRSSCAATRSDKAFDLGEICSVGQSVSRKEIIVGPTNRHIRPTP